MSDTFFKEFFISCLKEEIHAQVLMNHPETWLEAIQHAKEAQQVVFSQHPKPSFPLCPLPPTHAPHPTPLNI
jgi:hypothetical protein